MGLPATVRVGLVVSFIAATVAIGAKPKHIVFVLSDDLGWNAPSYMNPDLVTPTLDALAANGTVLSSFYTYMFCSPSRASFLTGRFPFKN